ncbi:MAG TPA: DUF4124 domain-containing protein [Telluria sp.]
MIRHTVRRTLFIAGMVFVSSTFAGTEVIKCTDDSGRVTLTDQPCQRDDEQLVLSAAATPEVASVPEAVAEAASSSARYQVRALPPSPRLRAAPYTDVQAPGRSLARDVATLKEARRTLMLLDSTMAASRQGRLDAQR